jgi:putative hydrolase of the HAD superfamily
MPRIRAFLLDLDDTLLDEQTASRVGFEALTASFSIADPSPEAALVRWRALSAVHWRRFEAGRCTFQEQRRGRVRDFLGTELDDDQADLTWEVYRSAYEASWTLVPHGKAFLDETRAYPRVVVTNGDREQQAYKLFRTGLSGHLPHVVTPDDAKAWKPDHRIFLHALRHLKTLVPGLQTDEVLMVGDDQARDIEPAQALGLQTFRVVPGRPDRGLAQVLALLRAEK